jgi:hypothetical protein
MSACFSYRRDLAIFAQRPEKVKGVRQRNLRPTATCGLALWCDSCDLASREIRQLVGHQPSGAAARSIPSLWPCLRASTDPSMEMQWCSATIGDSLQPSSPWRQQLTKHDPGQCLKRSTSCVLACFPQGTASFLCVESLEAANRPQRSDSSSLWRYSSRSGIACDAFAWPMSSSSQHRKPWSVSLRNSAIRRSTYS